MYAKYIKEREGKEIIEDEYGYATFAMFPDHCYVEDVFVLPEFRKSGYASGYIDKVCEIMKTRNIRKIFVSVDPRANGSTESMKIILAYGFKLHASETNMIYFLITI